MYEIFIERNAEKELDKLESGTFDTITENISNLAVYSAQTRPLIPAKAGHPFRAKPATILAKCQ